MRTVLAVNAGSSTLKLALFDVTAEARRRITAQVDRIGHANSHLLVRGDDGGVTHDVAQPVPSHEAALQLVLDRVPDLQRVEAVGHRVVRGGVQHQQPARITPALIEDLRASAAEDPDHGPQALGLIDRAAALYPGLPQVACFDTAFHRTMPDVAQLYAVPRRFRAEGVVRLGFHGLSCEHIMARLATLDPAAARGRIGVAHLGGGSSLTAISDGRSLDTTMGFSPTGGLVMSTRSGDLDPSVMLHLMERHRLDVDALRTLVNRECGLLGVSGISADMRELLEQEEAVPAAAQAVALFCYTARKHLGAMIAVLGGLDTLVFTGGIGEHAAVVRERICAGMESLGIELDRTRNAEHESVISSGRGRTIVRVIPADEELMIATHVRALLAERGATHVSF